MQEECGERDSLDFRISLPGYVLLDVAVAATGKQRNGIWSQNEDCGCHPFLYRNLWSFQWARKRAHQSGDCPVCWFGGRSTGSSVCSVRSVWPSTAQRDPQRLEGYCASFFPFRRLVTLLQSEARAAANHKTKI